MCSNFLYASNGDGFGIFGVDGCKSMDLASKWHYDVTLGDCDDLAWEGIQFIG